MPNKWGWGSLRLGRGREMGRGRVGLLTLIGSLRRLGDIHSQLSTEGVHAHHSRVDRGVSEGRELAVVAGDTVQGLCDVSCSLQNNLLKSNRNIPLSCPDSQEYHVPSVYYRPCLGLSMANGTNSCSPLNQPVCSVSSSSRPYHGWGN